MERNDFGPKINFEENEIEDLKKEILNFCQLLEIPILKGKGFNEFYDKAFEYLKNNLNLNEDSVLEAKFYELFYPNNSELEEE